MTGLLGEGSGAEEQTRSPRGVIVVGLGLGVFGLATYAYLGLAGRALGDVPFTPLSVLWSVLNAVGIGLFLPFEQEMARRTAHAAAAGEGNASAVRGALVAAGGLLGLVAVVCGVAGPFLADRLFAGQGALVVLLVLSMAGMAAAYLVRGLLSGNGRWGHYGAQLAVDGVTRMALAGGLYAAGVTNVLAFGAVMVIAPVVSVLVTTPRPATLVRPGPPVAWQVAAAALATLVAASTLSQVLANAGPVIVALLAGPDEDAAAGRFTAALVIARVPLFLFAAVQAVLLPGLAGMVGAGDAAGFRRRVQVVGLLTGAVGVLGTVAVWAVGPEVVPLLFGDAFGTDRAVITLIAASGAAFMLAQVGAQALLALGGERSVTVGWGIGLAALVVTSLVPGSIALRAAWALVVGSVVAMVVLAGALAVAVRRRWAVHEHG